MSDTLANIDIPINQWVDLYSLSSVSVGERVSVQNVGTCDIYLAEQLAQPSVEHDSYRIIRRGDVHIAEAGSSGIWAFCNGSVGKVNIEIYHSQASQRTSFNEIVSAELVPVTQMTANYGLPDKAFTFSINGASVSSSNSLFITDSGANQNSLAAILTRRQMMYRSGQGSICRLSATFDSATAGSQQFAGLITATDVLAFGYQDDEFGIVHGRNGIVEIQTLQVTTPAAGNENASIEIGGTTYTVALTAGSVQHNAIEIAGSLNVQALGYVFSSNNDEVTCLSILATAVGAFSFTSATAVAIFAQNAVGTSTTDTFYPQSGWNHNVLNAINPQKGNVYQVSYQYGFGHIVFSAEDPSTGKMTVVHDIEYVNENILPPIANPSVRAGWVSRNITNTTPLKVSGADVAMFNEGEIKVTNQPRSASNTQPLVGLTQTNIATFRNRIEFGSRRNRAEVKPLIVSASTDSTKGAILEVRLNATFDTGLEYSYLDRDKSIVEIATDNTSVTGGEIVAIIPVSISGNTIDLDALGVLLFPGETITISMAIIGGNDSSMTASIVVVEDL